MVVVLVDQNIVLALTLIQVQIVLMFLSTVFIYTTFIQFAYIAGEWDPNLKKHLERIIVD